MEKNIDGKMVRFNETWILLSEIAAFVAYETTTCIVLKNGKEIPVDGITATECVQLCMETVKE